jgi:hypothetical protein
VLDVESGCQSLSMMDRERFSGKRRRTETCFVGHVVRNFCEDFDWRILHKNWDLLFRWGEP